MGHVLVIGSANTDIVMQVPHLPGPGETVTGSHMQVLQGGKGANQAVAAARMGADTRFLSSLGTDGFGNTALEGYRREGIDTKFIRREDKPTGTALIHIDAQGENCISINPGANGEMTAEHVTDDLFERVELVLLQLEIPTATVLRAIDKASQLNIPVILNPAPAVTLEDLDFSKVFLFTPNETETEFYTGVRVSSVSDAQQACANLHSKGCQGVIITLGAEGVYCSTPDFKGLIKGHEATAIDTTAAGDVFNGALAAGFLQLGDLRQAIDLAQAAAAISVTRLGAQPSIPTREEVRSRYEI